MWIALGAVWVAVPCVLLLWLARPGIAGRGTVLWLFAVVWATDIGAYVFGRAIGGPRLAPTWSPNKTWAGLVGGMVCAGIVGWATTLILASVTVLPLVAASAGLAIVEQFGDLAESVAKRRFGVKDSSGLIPGHGGLLDRLDGLLAVIPAVALPDPFRRRRRHGGERSRAAGRTPAADPHSRLDGLGRPQHRRSNRAQPGQVHGRGDEAANRSKSLAERAVSLGARFAAVADPAAYAELKELLAGTGIAVGGGPESLIEAADRPTDLVMAGIVGAPGSRRR